MVSINVNDITLPRNKKRISKPAVTKPTKAVMKLIRQTKTMSNLFSFLGPLE